MFYNLPLNKTSSSYLVGSTRLISSYPSLWLQLLSIPICLCESPLCGCMSTPVSVSFVILLSCLFHLWNLLWNLLCVCLLYLANLLQESRLPAVAPSLHIHSVRHTSLPGGLCVYLTNTHTKTGFAAGYLQLKFVRVFVCVHEQPFVPFL